jgi:hypothetical protein
MSRPPERLNAVNRARHLLSPLWFLVALIGLIAGVTVSGNAAHGTETRVRAFDTPTAIVVESGTTESPGGVGHLRQVSAAFVSATGVATEAASAGDALVLGKYPDYIKLADELGARRFSIPDAEWNALTPEARWVANQAVLDQAITDRIPIVLSNPATPEFLTGTYADEISYLIKQGYEIGPNAMSMVPKGG